MLDQSPSFTAIGADVCLVTGLLLKPLVDGFSLKILHYC